MSGLVLAGEPDRMEASAGTVSSDGEQDPILGADRRLDPVSGGQVQDVYKRQAETFITEGKNKLIEDTKAKLSLDDLFSQIKAGNVKELPIIVKADVQGSVEAVKQSLVKLSNEEVVVKVIHGLSLIHI